MTTTINNKNKKANVPNLRFPEFEGEWEVESIKDVADFMGGGTPSSSNESFWQGTIPWVSSSDIVENDIKNISISRYITEEAIAHSATKLCPAPSILIVSRVGVGKIALSKEAICTSQDFCNLINIKVEPIFLTYCLSQIMKRKSMEVQGTSIKGITTSEIQKISINIPSLQEQKKIGKILSLLDERIATQNKIIDKLQSLIKGINQRVFMNSGNNYKLGEICEIRSGYSGSQHLSKKGLKVSRIETISGHKVNMERVGYVAPFESSENYRLRVGDILFSNINSVEYIGNTAFIDKDYDLYHGMNLLRLTPNNMVVIPFYLYLLLNTNRMLNRFKTVCNKAVSQASINQTELGKTVAQIPPINTQEQICELYQALYTKLEKESHTKSLFQNQKQYLLRQMFI